MINDKEMDARMGKQIILENVDRQICDIYELEPIIWTYK